MTDKPAAGHTGQPMRPENVPEEWRMLAVRANADRNHDSLCHCDAWPEQCVSGYTPGTWEHGDEADTIAAVLPAIRAAIADEILATTCPPGDQCADRWCPDCVAYRQAARDAAIARGDQ